VSLKQVDLKDHYNGQVPYEGFAYYNFLNYERGPEEVLELVREQAEGCFKICLDKLQKARERYARSCGGHSPPFELQHGVLTYDELFSLTVKRLGEARVTAELESVRKEFAGDPNHDLRELSLALVRRLWKLCGKTGPAAIVFIVPPYYPPNNPRIGDENSNRFNEKVHQAAASLCEGSPYSLEVRPFFPYLSDASFCSYREGKNNRMALERNMPCWEKGWKIDIDQVMRLNLPVLDMGVHGKDPHKIYERLDIRYAMIELPDMVAKMTRVLLAD